jgi:hypothetical protein
MRKLIGHIGVDSGQVLVTDPCYLDSFKNNEFKAKEWVDIQDSKGLLERVEKCSKRWFEIVDKINKGKLKIVKEEMEQLPRDYSYSGCAAATLSEEKAGELGDGMGVASSTGFGDGSYPVYVEYNREGRISRLIVDFVEEETDEDEDN